MNINLSISAAPGIASDYLVVAVYNSTAPTTVAAYRSFAAPHAGPVNITFTGLNPGVYIVITYQSPDGLPGGTVRHQFIYDPTFGSAAVRVDEVLIVGVTPGLTAGNTSYSDTGLAGWEYSIERRGLGTMIDVAKSTTFTEVRLKITGGFDLLATGDQFSNDEIFILHFLPIINNVEPSTSQTAGVLWSGAKNITTNTTLVAADMGKYCLIAGTSAVININLPAGDSVVDGTLIAFLSEGGSHLAANLIPAGTDQIKWLGDTWNNSDPLTICQGEEIWLAYHGTSWRVFMADGAWKEIGNIIHNYDKQQINLLQADGNPYNRAYYPRLWRRVQKFLASTILVSDTDWLFRQDSVVNGNPYHFYPNVTKFSSGDGSSSFRMPLLFKKLDSNGNLISGGYLRTVDGATDLAGVQVIDGVGNFMLSITLPTGDSFNGHPYPPTAFGKGLIANTPVNLPFDVFVTGKNPLTGVANNETRPFSANVYSYLKY